MTTDGQLDPPIDILAVLAVFFSNLIQGVLQVFVKIIPILGIGLIAILLLFYLVFKLLGLT